MLPFWGDSFRQPPLQRPYSGVEGGRGGSRIPDLRCHALIGADPDEIVFTSGATEANNLALFGLARRAPPSRRRILVSAIENKCVLEAARAVERNARDSRLKPSP